MSMPQSHLVALCTDLGISAQSGAMMLSLLLGLGVLGRQIWGAISDRIGGLLTLLISSILQALAMTGFVVTQDECGPLSRVAAAFGAGFSALIPAYVLAVREYFRRAKPAGACRWCCCSAARGMATGTWLAGALYDHFGYYAPAFAVGVGSTCSNFIVIATLVLRQRYSAPPGLTQRYSGLMPAFLMIGHHFVDLGLVPDGERLRRLLIARRHVEAEIVEALLHRRVGHRFHRRRVQPRDDILRRALRHPQPVPQRHVEAGQARLLRGRNVGRRREPLGVGDRIGADAAGADLLHRVRRLVDDDVDLAADEIVQAPARCRDRARIAARAR